MNIGELARLGQVSPPMLRHYDEFGLLRRVDAHIGHRLYAAYQLGRRAPSQFGWTTPPTATAELRLVTRP